MRPLTDRELPLVAKLLAIAGKQEDPAQLRVESLHDGGMGSVRIGEPNTHRNFGATVAEARFKDADGTLVHASLNADDDGQLFEADIWRVDFAPLQRWPSDADIA